MRVWLAPWEDDTGDLVVSGYIYTEIQPRRWVIGEEAPTAAPRLKHSRR
ncbi:TraV family lipoprotein [Pseudomonas luteola]